MRLLSALFFIAVAGSAAGCGSSDVSREVGARCSVMSDCDDRCLPPDAEFPDGLCTRSCLSNGDCPQGTVCADVEGGVCLFDCSSDASCQFLGPGWLCQTEDGRVDQAEVLVCIGND